MVILFSTKCFLFVYMYIDLLKLKACKLFENSDADIPGFFFREANLNMYMLYVLYLNREAAMLEGVVSCNAIDGFS